MFLVATSFNNGGSTSINNWIIKTTGPVSMSSMFYLSGFNQTIDQWNTSEVTSTFQMFQSSPFNQDISSWNVSKATDMRFMFQSSSFNQNLSTWSLRLTGILLDNIFTTSGMSTENYTDTIVGWSNYVQVNYNTPVSVFMRNQSGRTFQNSRSGGVGFVTAGDARTYLTNPTPAGSNWIINGDTVIA
jgi:surface protein